MCTADYLIIGVRVQAYMLRDTIIRRTGIFFQPVYNNGPINQPLDHSARAVVQTS